MRWSVLIVGFLLLSGSATFGIEESTIVRVTTYCRDEGELRAASNGRCLRNGHCAVDPKKIPYGSRVVLPDGTALSAVDTGSAVQNRKAARRAGRREHLPAGGRVLPA